MDPFDDIKKFEKLMKDMLEGLFGGSSVNVITPFRGVMATRAVYLKKKHDFSYTI